MIEFMSYKNVKEFLSDLKTLFKKFDYILRSDLVFDNINI